MGLEELLTRLDKKIWQKCENVTQLTSKELGWNKYDLKMITDAVSNIFLTGAGVHSFILGAYQINKGSADFWSYLLAGIGGALVPGGFLLYIRDKKYNKRLEESEIKLLEDKGVIYAPEFGPYRPVSLSMGVSFLPLAAAYKYTHESNIYYTAVALFFSAIGTSLATKIVSTYFQDQNMVPPTKKKSLREKMYELFLQPFQKIKKLRPENVFVETYHDDP